MADVRSSLGVALVLRTLGCSTGASPTAPTAAREEGQFQSIVVMLGDRFRDVFGTRQCPRSANELRA